MTPRGIGGRRALAGLLVVVVAGAAVAAFVAGSSAGRPRTSPVRVAQATEARGPLGPPRRWQRSVASTFTDYGDALACGGVLAPEQLGIASRTEPCGALVTLAYRGRVVRVPVIDRGPYVEGREWDLTGATARALRFPGLDEIAWAR
jgi:rare lipoprotein A